MNCIILFALTIIFVILLNIIFNSSGNEELTNLSNEALQTIGSVYSTGNMTVNNIAISEKLCLGKVCVTQSDLQKMILFWKLQDQMYDQNAIIYDNIFTAQLSNIIAQSGSPNAWNETTFASSLWNSKLILNIGNGNEYPNGLTINVPTGMTVIWVRILNDRWVIMELYNSSGTSLGKYSSGFRNLNNIDPNGNCPDSQWNVHKWIPMPVPQGGGKYTLIGIPGGNDVDNWISGIAFSTNPWNHAMNSAVAYTWQVNGGSAVGWFSNAMNNDILGQLDSGSITTLMVPVVPSGNDKLVYILEYNQNWVGTMHGNVLANGTKIERFRTTYTNPFATHNNSKLSNRYIAARIPNSLIKPADTVVTISIDMTIANNNIYFREIGTHDYLSLF